MKIKFIAIVVAVFATLSASAQTTATQPAIPKIGWTNVDYVLNVLPESKKIQNEVQIQQQQVAKASQEKEKELQDLFAAYQKNANTWSEIIRADKEKQIQQAQQNYQTFQQTAQESLQKKYQQMVEPVLTKINEAIQAVGKENNYTYILNMDAGASTTPIILYSGSDENSVTNLVLKKLGVDPVALEKQQQENAQKAVNAATPAANKPAANTPAANKPAPSTQTPVKKN